MSDAGIGHNGIEGGHLGALVERIERLEEDKKAVCGDIKEVYSEAKHMGYDPKIMRRIISMRKQGTEKRREEAEILDLYMTALGMENY